MSTIKMKTNLFVCAACLLGVLTATADTPWGWEIPGGEALSKRTSGGISLDTEDLQPGTTGIRLAEGTSAVDHIDLADCNLTIVGAAGGTTLVPSSAAVRDAGGAISCIGGSLVVSNIVFDGFFATDCGGALNLRELDGDARVDACRFVNCRTTAYAGAGGAIYASAAAGSAGEVTLAIRNCAFSGCDSANGGAISTERIYPYVEKAIALDVSGCTFERNKATFCGGALWIEGDALFAETRFEANVACGGGGGGAICVGSTWDDVLDVTVRTGAGVTFVGNAATDNDYGYGNGGAIALQSPGVSLAVSRTDFRANVCDYAGGAVFACGASNVLFETSIFSGNTTIANYGIGGTLDIELSPCALTNVTVRGSNAAALAFYEADTEIVNCVVVGNETSDVDAQSELGGVSLKMLRTAYGTRTGTGVDVVETQCLPGETTALYKGDSLYLREEAPYNPAAAEGLVQDATDFDGVPYGSRPFGYSMGAYECATISIVSSEPFEGVYDGNAHTITVAAATSVVDVQWKFSTVSATGPWGDENPAYTKVGTYWVWACAYSSEFQYALVTSNTVTITRRPIELVSASAEKTYDGAALTTNDVQIVGTLADGDTLTFQCTGSQTLAGTSANTFTYAMTSAGGASRTEDYAVTETRGELVVHTAPMPPLDHDPDPQGPDYPPAAGPFGGPDLPPGQDLPTPEGPSGAIITLSNYDVVTNYDGAAHTFDEAALIAKLEEYKAAGLFHGNAYTLDYSLTGVKDSWTSEPFAFTNVKETPTSFWYRVSIPNFTNYIHAVGVTITQRVVQVTSATDSWVFDGSWHKNETLTVTGGSFAGAEYVTGSNFATIKEVGTLENTFTVVWTAADPSNYSFSQVSGVLEVTPRPSGPTFNPVADVFYYNADGKQPKPGVTDLIGGELVELVEGRDFVYSWLENTNATETAKLVATFMGNYSGAITNDFAILPRLVELTSGTETWTYDSFAHSNVTVTATPYNGTGVPAAGFVPGEGVTTAAFTQVTTVTSGTPNAFAWSCLANTLATNYTVRVTEGTLVILAAPLPQPDHDPDPQGPNYPPAAGPFGGPDLPPGQDLPLPVGTNDTTITLSDYDVVTVYDGQPHTFAEEELIAKLEQFKADGLFYGNDYTLEYSLTGVKDSWVSDPFTFTNVGETPASFWYRVSVPNFTNCIHAVGVTITQRVVYVEFPQAEKTYDGTVAYTGVLQTNVVSGTHNMVAGEAFTADARGYFADLSAGETDLVLTNVALTAVTDATLFSNYQIYFGANGKTLFDPDTCVGPGPVSFGPDDANWPKNPEDQPTAPAFISRGELLVEAIGALRDYDGISTNIQVIVNDGAEILGWYRILYAPDLAIPSEDVIRTGSVQSKATRAQLADAAADAASGRPPDDSELWSETMPRFVCVATNVYAGAHSVYDYDGTNGSYVVWYRVQSQNYEEISGYATVTVVPRTVRFEFPKVTKQFDGDSEWEKGVETNLIHATHSEMVEGEEFDAVGQGHFRSKVVGSDVDYFVLTNMDVSAIGVTQDRNYIKEYEVDGQISVISKDASGKTTVNGKTFDEMTEDDYPGSSAEITPAPSKPDDENPHPQPAVKPDPAGGDPVAPPQPTEPLSDYDTTNVYDGVGHTLDTNALWNALWDPSRYVVDEAEWEKVRVRYSLDGAVWSDEPPLFTDATVTSFWYSVEMPNYETVVHAVAVTVGKRGIHLKANFQSMVYDDLSTLTPGLDVPAAWDENPVDQLDANLLAGDGLKFVSLTFDRPYADYRPGETNLAAIVTNAVESVYAVTNAQGDVTRNYEIQSFLPGDLWVEENLALFKATLKWMYVSDSFVAQLTIENTNRTARFRYEPGSMKFCFADRANTPYGAIKLWDWQTYGAVQTTHALGRAFTLADPDPQDPVGGWQPNTPVVYGPATTTITLAEGFSYIGKAPYVWVENREAPLKDSLQDYEGYLVWVSDGQEQSIKLVAEQELERQDPPRLAQAAEPEDALPRFETSAASETVYRYVAVSNVLRVLGTQGGSVTFKKVSGSLPGGLSAKYDAAANALVIAGVPTATDAKTGVKSFEAVYQVIETRKVSGKTVKVTGETVRLAYAVVDPAVAGGADGAALNAAVATARTYSDLMVLDADDGALVGTLTLTIPRTGKASAKLLAAAGKLSFATKSWSGISSDGSLELKLACTTAGSRAAVLTASVDATGLKAVAITGVGETAWTVQPGTLWSKTKTAEAYAGTYTVALPVDEIVADPLDYAPKGAVALSLKMTAAAQFSAGRVTWAGTLADGTAISGKAVLTEQVGDETVALLPVFLTSKKNVFGAVVPLGAQTVTAPTLEVDGAPLAVWPYWTHTEGAKDAPDAGYRIRYGLYGSRYAKEDSSAVSSQAFVFDGLENPEKVKFSVTADGVVSGSFTFTPDDAKKGVSAKFKGVVLSGWGGGTESSPFILGAWSFVDKLPYSTATGTVKYLTVQRGDVFTTACSDDE